MTIDIPWIPVLYTDEKVLRHRDTGQLIEFTDDYHAPSQELPVLGLADMFSQEDMDKMMRRYTPYELLSGGS